MSKFAAAVKTAITVISVIGASAAIGFVMYAVATASAVADGFALPLSILSAVIFLFFAGTAVSGARGTIEPSGSKWDY